MHKAELRSTDQIRAPVNSPNHLLENGERQELLPNTYSTPALPQGKVHTSDYILMWHKALFLGKDSFY